MLISNHCLVLANHISIGYLIDLLLLDTISLKYKGLAKVEGGRRELIGLYKALLKGINKDIEILKEIATNNKIVGT